MSTTNIRKEFVLSSDGKIIHRTITENEKELTNAHLAQIGSQQVLFHKNVFEHGQLGPIHIGLSKTAITMTGRLKAVRIKANYVVVNDVLVPAFDRPKEPVFDINWTPPEDMKMLFVLELNTANMLINAHMPVLDADKRCYRLPLGNIYETGSICLGEARVRYSGVAKEVFEQAFEQFHNSQWNNDLQAAGDTDAIRQLFRFKPYGDGLAQLPVPAHWKKICKVIAPPILNSIQI